MKCQNCESERVANVCGKVSDMCFVTIKGKEKDGYVPGDMGIGGADYLEFCYCLDCGKIQGKFPLAKTDLELKNE